MCIWELRLGEVDLTLTKEVLDGESSFKMCTEHLSLQSAMSGTVRDIKIFKL